jgi:hypothetical protein
MAVLVAVVMAVDHLHHTDQELMAEQELRTLAVAEVAQEIVRLSEQVMAVQELS